MKYLMGIDLGTSGTKTALFDENGMAVFEDTEEYVLYQPQNGWAEQDPNDWWKAVVVSIRTVLSKSGIEPSLIMGIGLTGQMHGLVMLDSDNEVLRHAIIWCDQRSALQCEQITSIIGKERLIEITANPALPGFTASKILWVQQNEPKVYEKCRHILLPKDYIRFKLTGRYATDVSDASGMQLLDVPKRCWSEEVLSKLNIERDMLGEVYESQQITGSISHDAAVLTGLKEGTPVVGGAGDNASAAVGMGVVREGRAFTSIGTSGVVFAHSSDVKIDPEGRIHTFCCAVPGQWHTMGVTLAAGLSLKWFRDNFCTEEINYARRENIDPYVIMDQKAEAVSPGCDRLIYLPYLMGERTPHLDANCRGVFFGLSAIHTRAHLIRAVMEGISFSLLDCLNIIREIGMEVSDMMICGGGSRSTLWRSILSTLYDCNISTIKSGEGAVLGAAILAGVGTGIYSNVPEACDKLIIRDKVQKPVKELQDIYSDYYGIYRELYPLIKDEYRKLAGLKL